jgi:hypothetical protein
MAEITKLLIMIAQENPGWGLHQNPARPVQLTEREIVRAWATGWGEPSDDVDGDVGQVHCRERLGGMLRYHYRRAA